MAAVVRSMPIRARTLTYGGTISNVAGQIGNFSTNSVGLLILTGTSTYSGTTTITAGTIRLGVTNALPTTTTLGFDITNTLYTAGATLDLYGNNQTVAGLTDASTATLGRFITNSNTGTSTLDSCRPGIIRWCNRKRRRYEAAGPDKKRQWNPYVEWDKHV